jgi:hypothetical protein
MEKVLIITKFGTEIIHRKLQTSNDVIFNVTASILKYYHIFLRRSRFYDNMSSHGSIMYSGSVREQNYLHPHMSSIIPPMKIKIYFTLNRLIWKNPKFKKNPES